MVPKLPYRGWLFDLDGTIYLGERLIPGADATIAALRAADRRVAFLSNTPLQTRTEYAAKLTRLGVPAAATARATPPANDGESVAASPSASRMYM